MSGQRGGLSGAADGDMITERVSGEHHIANLLAGVVRLVRGAVAATFVPKLATDSPVVSATLGFADVGTAIGALATHRVGQEGPWGELNGTEASGPWTAVIEPVVVS